MKLLFDENLSDRLVPALADMFLGSSHVKAVGLIHQSDDAIWEYAVDRGYVIVTKDSDFYERCAMEGPPPKIIFLQIGNAPTRTVLAVIMANHQIIEGFGQREAEVALVLGEADRSQSS